MDDTRLDDLLEREATRGPGALPRGFADGVVRRVGVVREAAIRHRKTLMTGSAIAIVLAVSSSYLSARRVGERSRESAEIPKSPLFHFEASELPVPPSR